MNVKSIWRRLKLPELPFQYLKVLVSPQWISSLASFKIKLCVQNWFICSSFSKFLYTDITMIQMMWHSFNKKPHFLGGVLPIYVHLSLSLPWTRCPNSLLWQWSSGSTLKKAGIKDLCGQEKKKKKKTLTVGFYWLNHFGGILGVLTKSGTHFTDNWSVLPILSDMWISFVSPTNTNIFFNIKQQLYGIKKNELTELILWLHRANKEGSFIGGL